MLSQTTKQNSLVQTTLVLALGAETAFFGTLVMSYLFLRTGGSNETFIRFGKVDLLLASLNTLILLASAATVWASREAVVTGRVDRLITHLVITLALGVLFILGQVFEFNHSGLKMDATVFGSACFALISFHALHVLAGMTIHALNLARARLGDFSARRHTAVSVGTWFWYYVTAVWLVLFAVLYLI